MKKDEEKKGFFSNWIVKNLLWAMVAILAIILLSAFLLSRITHHGKVIMVPDFTGMTVNQADQYARDASLRIDIADSVFVKRMARGAVFSQNPKPGATVKTGRRVMLTINAMNAKKVSMPNLVGYSMRQAKAELNSRGLTLGRLLYIDDMATNNVLRQLYKNRQIEAGQMIDSGSEIDLMVGLNDTDNQTYIPDVTGMKYLRAVDVVHDNSLNIKALVFDKSVKTYADSINAQVWKQAPQPSKAPILMGSDVSLYLSVDPDRTLPLN